MILPAALQSHEIRANQLGIPVATATAAPECRSGDHGRCVRTTVDYTRFRRTHRRAEGWPGVGFGPGGRPWAAKAAGGRRCGGAPGAERSLALRWGGLGWAVSWPLGQGLTSRKDNVLSRRHPSKPVAAQYDTPRASRSPRDPVPRVQAGRRAIRHPATKPVAATRCHACKPVAARLATTRRSRSPRKRAPHRSPWPLRKPGGREVGPYAQGTRTAERRRPTPVWAQDLAVPAQPSFAQTRGRVAAQRRCAPPHRQPA